MDYKEIIERELERLCAVKGEQNNTIDLNAYGVGVLDGINSPLAKQITEIEVVKGKIEVLKGLQFSLPQEIGAYNECKMDIEDLEQLRDKLINELKMK